MFELDCVVSHVLLFSQEKGLPSKLGLAHQSSIPSTLEDILTGKVAPDPSSALARKLGEVLLEKQELSLKVDNSAERF